MFSPQQFIEEKIKEAFNDLAKNLGNYNDELPFNIVVAETDLLRAWQGIVIHGNGDLVSRIRDLLASANDRHGSLTYTERAILCTIEGWEG